MKADLWDEKGYVKGFSIYYQWVIGPSGPRVSTGVRAGGACGRVCPMIEESSRWTITSHAEGRFSVELSRCLSIGVSPVSDTNDQNDKLFVPEFVHDAVVFQPDAPEPTQVALQRSTEMRGPCQPVDRCDDPGPVWPGHTPQFPRGARRPRPGRPVKARSAVGEAMVSSSEFGRGDA